MDQNAIDKLMKLDMSFPGISFGYHSRALSAYLDSLEESAAHAGAQYRLRKTRELELQSDKLFAEEHAQELAGLDALAEDHIPHYARISAILLLWGLFEHTVFDLTRYVTNRESKALKLRQIRADNYVQQVRRYYSDVLGIPIPWSPSVVQALQVLNVVRDACAHRNGNYMDAAKEQTAALKKNIENVCDVRMSGSQLDVGAGYVL
ncbi:MAG: hypothetical protein GKR94_16875 [Gammaproteobacteria bacterium]|nr:hypothetical protein [Gammaproteobacteria bacterium]